MDNIEILDSYIKDMVENHHSKYLCLSNFFDFSLVFKTNSNYSVTAFNILEIILKKSLIRIERIENLLSIFTGDGEYCLFDYSSSVIQ